jgi:hypothetical protein
MLQAKNKGYPKLRINPSSIIGFMIYEPAFNNFKHKSGMPALNAQFIGISFMANAMLLFQFLPHLQSTY